MKIDLCKIFGVEEGEEFRFKNAFNEDSPFVYIIKNNELLTSGVFKRDGFRICNLSLNAICNMEVIKLPKKKEFTDDELCILRNIDKEYKWIARDGCNDLCICGDEPKKDIYRWSNNDDVCFYLDCYTHLFNSISWEDEEPVFIDDYVERSVE